MDFEDTPEEAAFRAQASAWLEANVEHRRPGEDAGVLGERDDPGTLAAAKAWQACKAYAGWACLTWPEEYGGRAHRQAGITMSQVTATDPSPAARARST